MAGSFEIAGKPTTKEVRDFHTNSDVDGSPKSQHHTLGPGPNQAAPGNHTHDGGGSTALDPEVLPVWTSLTSLLVNGWGSFGAPYSSPKYMVDRQKIYLHGMIKNAVTSTTGVLFTLPTGARPFDQTMLWAECSVNGICRIEAYPNGDVSVISYNGGNGNWISLDTIPPIAMI